MRPSPALGPIGPMQDHPDAPCTATHGIPFAVRISISSPSAPSVIRRWGRSSLKLESVGDTTKVERNQRAVQLTEHQPPNQAVSLTCSQCLSLDHEPSCPMEVLSLVQVRSRMVHDAHASHLESKERDSTTEGEELCSRTGMRRALNHLAAHGLHGGGELRPMLHGISINPEDLRRDEKVLDGTHLRQKVRWRCSLP